MYATTLQSIRFRKTNFTRNTVALVEVVANGKAHGSAIYTTRTSASFESCNLINNTGLYGGSGSLSYGALYMMEPYRLDLFACTFLYNNNALVNGPFRTCV